MLPNLEQPGLHSYAHVTFTVCNLQMNYSKIDVAFDNQTMYSVYNI